MMNKGDKISKKQILSILESKYTDLLSYIVNYVPLGFNDLYTIAAEKIFKIRPKVVQNTYNTRSGSILDLAGGDTSQYDIGAAYLGSPYTLELGKALGLSTYSNSSRGNSEQPFIKSEPLLPYEPVSDLIGGGVPFHGNSPFIWRGYLAFSNFFEDSNIRTTIDTSGDSIQLKAKSISVMMRPQSTSDFTVSDDSMSSYTDRSNLEIKSLFNIDKTITSSSLVSGSGSGDYLLWLIHNDTTLDTLLIGVKWDSDLTTVNSIVNTPYAGYFTDYSGYLYTRPIAVVYYDGSHFLSSAQQAWGEPSSTLNASPLYGKQYQQVSSPNPLIRESTSEDDRRIIPSHVYIDQKNNSIIGKTVYSGLVRHIPGCGGSKVKMQVQTGDYPDLRNVKIDIGQIELTDGSTSIWVKDLDIPTIIFDSAAISSTIDTLDNGLQLYGGYLWLCADPSSILDSTSIEKSNLKLKLFLSKSPTWDPDWNVTETRKRHGNLGVESIYSNYTHRCRLGWLYHYYNSTYGDATGGYRMTNGVYTNDTDLYGRSKAGLSSISGFYGGWTIGTGYTFNGRYDAITNGVNYGWGFLPWYGSNGTSLGCSEVRVGLYINSGTSISMGTAPWVALSTTKDRFGNFQYGAGTSGTRPNTLTTSSYQDYGSLAYTLRSTDSPGALAQSMNYEIKVLPVDVDGVTRLMYSGTGGDNTALTRKAIVLGWTLDIGNF